MSSVTKTEDGKMVINTETLTIQELDKLIDLLREHLEVLRANLPDDHDDKSPDAKKTKRDSRLEDELKTMETGEGSSQVNPSYNVAIQNRLAALSGDATQPEIGTGDPGSNTGADSRQKTQTKTVTQPQTGTNARPQTRTIPQTMTAAPKTPTKKTIPPIVLRDKTKWTNLQTRLRLDKISYTRAVNASEGIRIYPETDDDYRQMIKMVEAEKVPYHSYKLPEDQNLKVVLRGIPSEYDTDVVIKELTDRHFPPIKTIRLTKTKDGKTVPMPLVLIILDKTHRKIYDMTDLLGLKITVEPLKNTRSNGQCYRCQLYGHAQGMCRAPHRCVRCGGAHMAHACPKATSEAPTCANCRGPHPANYGGCPLNPKNRPKTRQQIQTRPTITWANINKDREQTNINMERNFPPLPKPRQTMTATNTNKYAEVADTLGRMLTQFSQTNPTGTQTVNFTNDAIRLLTLLN